jgi:pimeloyl-ACP methyl ester carboxylesterase
LDRHDSETSHTLNYRLGWPPRAARDNLHSDGLNNAWDWVDKDLTIVTVPGSGHFVQQDAAELVTTTMRSWLGARRG